MAKIRIFGSSILPAEDAIIISVASQMLLEQFALHFPNGYRRLIDMQSPAVNNFSLGYTFSISKTELCLRHIKQLDGGNHIITMNHWIGNSCNLEWGFGASLINYWEQKHILKWCFEITANCWRVPFKIIETKDGVITKREYLI